MTSRARLLIALLWIASLVGVAATVKAQDYAFRPLPEPKVITGADLGFRLEGMRGDQPAGTLVIRLNGKWVEPTTAPRLSPRPATQ
jgi:hypothetical protein